MMAGQVKWKEMGRRGECDGEGQRGSRDYPKDLKHTGSVVQEVNVND